MNDQEFFTGIIDDISVVEGNKKELTVFKKLRERFPHEGQVKYQQKHNRQEPDFIFNTNCGSKEVVYAKYKPCYNNGCRCRN